MEASNTLEPDYLPLAWLLPGLDAAAFLMVVAGAAISGLPPGFRSNQKIGALPTFV
jgi:hypothetical protein